MTGAAPALPQTQMFTASRKRAVFLGGPLLLLALLGLALGLGGIWAGWLIGGLFAFGGGAIVASTFPSLSHLKLDRDGLTLRSLFYVRRYKWADIHSFFVTRVDQGRVVGFDFADRPALSPAKLALHKARGYDVFLPDSYGQDPEKLAALLERWREACS